MSCKNDNVLLTFSLFPPFLIRILYLCLKTLVTTFFVSPYQSNYLMILLALVLHKIIVSKPRISAVVSVA